MVIYVKLKNPNLPERHKIGSVYANDYTRQSRKRKLVRELCKKTLL